MNEFYFIGKIISSGKDGFVKVELIPGIIENLKKINHILLDFWEQKKIIEIEEVLNTKNSTFLKFKNFDIDREISLLIGREIFITQNDINSLKLFIPIEQNYLGYKVYQRSRNPGYCE